MRSSTKVSQMSFAKLAIIPFRMVLCVSWLLIHKILFFSKNLRENGIDVFQKVIKVKKLL